MIILFNCYCLNSTLKAKAFAFMSPKIKNKQKKISYDMRATNTEIGDTRPF